MFGERARRGDAEQPSTTRSLGDFDGRLLLKTQDLDGPARQPQPTGRERQTRPLLVNNGSSSSLRN